MNPEILQKWEAAAKELWKELPELRTKYHHDLPTYLRVTRARLEAQQEWRDNPSLQRDFGEFSRFLFYKEGVAKGLIIDVKGGRQRG
ncbi:MAG: hypothetical protein ACHQ2F_01095 [Desulfobaccales bacterium]